MYEIHNFNRKIIPFDTISFNWISFLHLTILYTSQSNENSVYSSSSFTNNNKKLGILQKYIFHRSSLFFYDNTIFHLLIASKITPKKYWYYFYIFIGIFFSIGNKESALNGYSFACPFILSDIFPNYNNLRAYSCYCTSS